ncbi:MAG: flagellar biosynthesis protein FlhA [Deltaproteobacteria bacterium]|nr:MAG: flagellar biosynthesis protein FlhA [Deltaproteobacteria bacterium]
MLERLLKQGDLALAIIVVLILGLMIIPIPPALLDICLSFSITFSVIILLVTAYVAKPLDFSVFPSILLIATLLRLSLNVASTRLILTRGDVGVEAAGKVIKSFGQFVVGGNFVIGFVVFLILVVINFVVITKGAGRIAEVSARFVLDAMPGKQMSIDADLNAGLIDEEEARRRRQEISREADFYGAMDGASKFVRGDAIAGIIITLINIIGGLLIGTLQKGMPLGEAARTYTILTIGDGLVAQIPALITSTAAGVIVSRAAAEANLGGEVIRQVFMKPKAMGTAAGILFFFGLIPGLPHVPFLLLAAVAGGGAYLMRKEEVEAVERVEEEPPSPTEEIDTLLQVDPLTLEIGYGLISLVEGESQLLTRIRALRKQLILEMGFVIPPVHIKDNLNLKPTEYSILIHGIDVSRGEVFLDRFLVIMPDSSREKLEGISTKDPAFGLPALWIEEKDVERARLAGFTVVDPVSVIITHLTEIIKKFAHEILGKQDVQKLLDNLSLTQPKVVEDLVPNLLPLGAVHRVLQNLLKEKVSIRSLSTILETLSDYASTTKDPDVLTEYVRQALSRWITKQYQDEDGVLRVILLDPAVERVVKEGIQTTPQGTYLALEPGVAERIVGSVRAAAEEAASRGHQPVLLCSPAVRRYVRGLLERVLPHVAVMSYAEVAQGVQVDQLGVVKLD